MTGSGTGAVRSGSVFEDGACGWEQHVTCTHSRGIIRCCSRMMCNVYVCILRKRLCRGEKLWSRSQNINATHLTTSTSNVFFRPSVCGQVNPTQILPVLCIWCWVKWTWVLKQIHSVRINDEMKSWEADIQWEEGYYIMDIEKGT